MKRRLFILICILLLSVAGIGRAQETVDSPLLMLVNGEDVWSYSTNAGLLQISNSGYAGRPVVTRDGSLVAYKVIAPIGIQALQATGGLVSELPSDIVIRSIATGNSTQITEQPPDATFDQGEPAVAVVRSTPDWSPDGTMLVWTEDAAPENVRRLVIYSTNGEARVIADDLPLQAGFQQTLPVRWGEAGIALKSTTAPDTSGAITESMMIYSPEGTRLVEITPAVAAGEYIYEFVWITDVDGVEKLGVIYSSGRWDLIDPATGVLTPLNGFAEVYSLNAPDALAVRFGVTSLPNVGQVFTWQVGDVPLPFTGPLGWIAIAPDGNAIAYAKQGSGYLWRDGVEEAIWGTNSYDFSVSEIVWGPVGWRVR